MFTWWVSRASSAQVSRSELETFPRALGTPLYQLFYMANKRPSYRIFPSARVADDLLNRVITFYFYT